MRNFIYKCERRALNPLGNPLESRLMRRYREQAHDHACPTYSHIPMQLPSYALPKIHSMERSNILEFFLLNLSESLLLLPESILKHWDPQWRVSWEEKRASKWQSRVCVLWKREAWNKVCLNQCRRTWKSGCEQKEEALGNSRLPTKRNLSTSSIRLRAGICETCSGSFIWSRSMLIFVKANNSDSGCSNVLCSFKLHLKIIV